MTSERHRAIRAALVDAGVPIDQADATAAELAGTSTEPGPAGLTGRGDPLPRSHPLRVLLDHAALGEAPTDAALDALGLAEEHRKAAQEAAARAVELHRAGDRTDAREHAREAGQALWAQLPADAREHRRAEPVTTTNPAELAANLPRF